MHAISETYQKGPGDDIYANNPVSYVKVDRLPGSDDWSPIIDAMKRGDYFVTSGEVLIPSYSIEGAGTDRTIVADVEWTFPLDFVEVVWGDGQTTDWQIVSATDLPPFGSQRFEIPFDARARNGCVSRRGTRRVTAHSCSRSSCRPRRAPAPVADVGCHGR